MSRGHVLPLFTLAAVVLADLLVGPGQVLLGSTVVSPMVAATVLRRRTTAQYGVATLVTAGLLGIYDEQYTAESLATQITRLVLVSVGAAAAVVACHVRQQRERTASHLAAERAAERAADLAVLEMAETLQRSLLVVPPVIPGLDTAVRYRSATRGTAIGGDWYDVFTVPDGATMLVMGDVVGHDAVAAATMAQTRGLLRGLAQSVVGSPAAVLTALDRALADLGIDALATVTVATLDPGANQERVRLCWSNAGHPPPALVPAAGEASLLERPVDPLLGVRPDHRRTDHELYLHPGDVLLFYTDGLIERRGVPLDDGLAELLVRLDGSSGRPLGDVCDDLLTGLDETADDVALLAVRIG